MWIKEGLNDVSDLIKNNTKEKAIEDLLQNVKMSISICQFVIDAILNTNNIQSEAKVYPGVLEELERIQDAYVENYNSEMEKANDLLKQVKNHLNKRERNKIRKIIDKFKTDYTSDIKMFEERKNDVLENPFILREIGGYDQDKIWALIAGFKIVSLSDRNLNLVDHATWEQIFQGRFMKTRLNNRKSIDKVLQTKFDTIYENNIVSKQKPELLDRKNKKREAQMQNLSDEVRDVLEDCFENGVYMNYDVLHSIYECLKSISNGGKVGDKQYNHAIRYMSQYDEKTNSIIYKDEVNNRYVFKYIPVFDSDNGIIEIDITSDAEARGSRRVLYFNPHQVKNQLCSQDVLTEYVLTDMPRCYTSKGELLEIKEGQPNKFIYQYIKLLRNDFAHGAYNIYKNHRNGYWVNTGNEGAELHYPYMWLQNLQTSFNTIEQVLYGEHSQNRGSLQYYGVSNVNTNVKTNNVFTLAIVPEISKGTIFKDMGDVIDLLRKSSYFTVEINDDIPHSEAETLIKNIANRLSAKQTSLYETYKRSLDDYVLKLEKEKVPSTEIFRRKEAKSKELKLRIEQDMRNRISNELGNVKLFGKEKLKDYIVETVSIVDDSELVKGAINNIADMMANAGCFDLDENKVVKMSAETQYQKLFEALNIGSDSNLKLFENKGNDVLDYTQLGWLMDIVSDSNEYPACNPRKGGDENYFGIGVDCVKALSLYKKEVLSSIGAFAMYSAIVANGYNDAINGKESKYYGLNVDDATNLANINMKELVLTQHFAKGDKKLPLMKQDIKNRQLVIDTLRNAVAHGNIKTAVGYGGLKKPNDLTFTFMDVNCANGNVGYSVDMNLAGLMRFVSNPTFSSPTATDHEYILDDIKYNQKKYGYNLLTSYENGEKNIPRGKKLTLTKYKKNDGR